MIISKSTKIGGHWATIWEMQEVRNDEGQLCDGLFNAQTMVITLDADMGCSKQEAAFIHEIFEALTSQYGIPMKHEDLRVLAEAFYGWLKDNYEMTPINDMLDGLYEADTKEKAARSQCVSCDIVCPDKKKGFGGYIAE